MAHLMTYQRTVVGYHGCDATTAERVLDGKAELNVSKNVYDWAGRLRGAQNVSPRNGRLIFQPE